MHITFELCFARITKEKRPSLACAERAVFCVSCQTCLTRLGQVEWTCLASQLCGTSCSGGERSFSSMTETVQALSVAWSSSKVSPFVHVHCVCVCVNDHDWHNQWFHSHTSLLKLLPKYSFLRPPPLPSPRSDGLQPEPSVF